MFPFNAGTIFRESTSTWLKLYIWFFCVHVDGDVVSGMAAYQPVVLVCILCSLRVNTSAHCSGRKQVKG
jgi:hypothetical protein